MTSPKKKGLPSSNPLKVWIGVEPTNDGFADRSLTAWVPHQMFLHYIIKKKTLSSEIMQAEDLTLKFHFEQNFSLPPLKK